MTTIFTDIIEGRRSGHMIYEDEKHVAILDKYPIDIGHTLLITRHPYEKITDMKKKDVSELFSLVPEIASAIMKATVAVSVSIAQNNCRAAKQIIPHVHVHIIPRYANKATLWTKRGIPTDNELTDLSEKIRTCF